MNKKIFFLMVLMAFSAIAKAQYTIHVIGQDGTDNPIDIKEVELFRWWNMWLLEMVGKDGNTKSMLDSNDFSKIYWTKDQEQEADKADIYMSDEILTVRTADYSITLDPTVLSDSAKLVVTHRYDLKDPFDGKARRTAVFDFNLDGKHELTGTAEIRIPISVDEGFIPCAGYFNPDTKEWEAVDHHYDSSTGEMVITTGHLSTFGAFSISNEYTREAKLNYMYMPELENTNVCDIALKLKKIMDAPNPEMQALDEFLNDVDVVKTLGLDFGYSALESMGFLPSFSEEFGGLISDVGVGLNTYQVCHAAYEGNDAAIAGGTLKLIIGKITEGLASVLESSIMTASMSAVAFIDYSINKFATTAVEGRKDIYRAAYRYYYSKAGSGCATYRDGYVGYRSATDWYKLFYPIMSRTDLNEKELTTLIDDTVRTFCNQIWEDESGLAAAMNEARNMGWTGGGGLNASIKKELSDEFRSELYNGIFVSVFTAIKKHLETEYFEKLLKDVESFGSLMNRVATIKLTDSSKGTGASTFSGYKVRFASMPSEIQDPEKWECTLDENGSGNIQFRLFPYISYGFQPRLVLVNDDDEEVATYEFSIDYSNDHIQPTTIDLATAGIDIPAAVDEWQFEITPASVLHSSGAEFLIRDEWNDGLKKLFDADRTITPSADGSFTIQHDGLTISGVLNPQTGRGEGTFTVNTSYEYVSPLTLEQRAAWWTDIWKAVNERVQQGENAAAVLTEKTAEYPQTIWDNWISCSVQQNITGTFTMKYSQKEQKYKMTFEGEGTFSLDGTGQYSLDYNEREEKCTVQTDRISVKNGKSKLKALLIY